MNIRRHAGRLSLLIAAIAVTGCGEPGAESPAAGQPRWTTPVQISRGAGLDGNGPQLGIDGAGNVFAVWEETDPTIATIWASRLPAGGTWGDPEVVGRGEPGSSAAFPALAVHPGGDALVVWTQKTDRSLPWFNRYVAGQGWGTPGPLPPGGSGAAEAPAVASRGNGEAVAVWSSEDAIWLAEYTTASGWETPRVAARSTAREGVGRPQVAAAGGATALAWMQAGNDGLRHTVATVGSGTSPASSWHAIRTLVGGSRACCYLSNLAGDGRGNAVILYGRVDPYSGYGGLSSFRFTADTGWSGSSSTGAAYADGLLPGKVALGPDGRGFALLVGGRTSHLWSMRYDGTAWAAAEPIEGTGTSGVGGTDVAAGNGGAFALWTSTATPKTTWAAQLTPEGRWSPPQDLREGRGTGPTTCGGGSPDPFVWGPAVVADARGNAVGAWVEHDCVGRTVWASRLDARLGR